MLPQTASFSKSVLSEISKLLIPRIKTQIPFNRAGMTESEWLMFQQKSKLKAAVLIPLCDYKNKPSILYTQRSHQVSTHSNEISFPGGYRDHKDESLLHSALREFHEELGVNFTFSIPNDEITKQFHVASSSESIILSQPYHSNSSEPGCNPFDIQILGSLFNSVPSKHGTSVQPIVGYLKLSKLHQIKKSDLIHDLLQPNIDEVQRVFCVPIEELMNIRYQHKDDMQRRGIMMRYRVPSSPCGDIWGFTGFLTQHLMNHVIAQAFRNQLR